MANRLFFCLLLCSAAALSACGTSSDSGIQASIATNTPEPSPPHNPRYPQAQSDPSPTSQSDPDPSPTPTPTSQSDSDPSPTPTPTSQSDPDPSPTPTPTSQSDSDPSPTPTPTSQSDPDPDPSPTPQGQSTQTTNLYDSEGELSGITEIGNISGFNYSIQNKAPTLESSIEFASGDFASYQQRPITATYSNPKGFRGIWRNTKLYGTITADVDVSVTFRPDKNLNPFINYLTIGKNSGLILGGRDYGHINFSSMTADADGSFSKQRGSLYGEFVPGTTTLEDGPYESITNTTTLSVNGALSNDAQYVAGEVKMTHTYSQVRRGGAYPHHGVTSLVGVFVAEED